MDHPWHILLIDDDEDDYIIFRGMLQEAREGSYRVDWERDYPSGLKTTCARPYDAILVDNVLGADRGLDLIAEAAEKGTRTPFILLTGQNRDRDDLEALRAGAVDFLDKNILTPALLEKTIRYAVQRGKDERALQASEKKYQDIVASIRDGFMVVDRVWEITYANESAVAGQGVSPHAVTGKNLWDVYPTLLGTEVEKNYRAAMHDRQPRRFEGKGAYQPENWFEMRVYPAEEGLSIFWTDITERRVAEEERKVALEELHVTMEELDVANDESIKAALDARETALTMEAVINNLTDAVLVFDENEKAVQANPYARKIFGFDPTGLTLQTVLLKSDIRVSEGLTFSVWEKQNKLVDHPDPITDLPATFTNKSGESYSVLFSIIALDRTSPRPGKVLLLKDVTREMSMLKQAQENEQHYRDLFASMNEGFALHEIITDDTGRPVDYRFLEINPAFERLTGLKREDVLGRTHNEVLPDDDPLWHEKFGEVALTGKPAHFENYSPILDRTYEVHAYSPALRQFAVVFMNVTERKRMENDLRVSLAKYESLFNAFPLGITVSDREGNILESNEEAERLLGISKKEHTRRGLGSDEWTIINPDGNPMPPDDYPSVRALKEHRRVEDAVLGVVKPDGEVTWLNVTATPLPADGFGVVVAYSDITERRRMEVEAVEQRAQIDVQRRLIRQREQERLVVASQLHDGPFQTLNAAHMGLMDALRHEDHPEHLERLQWIQAAFDQQIQEMRAFIQELRPPALMAFGLHTTIRSHLEMFRRMYPDIAVESDLARDGTLLPEEVRLALYRIYQELMSNAGRHSKAGKVKVRLQVDDGSVELQVSDDGVGFAVPEQWTELALSDHLGLIGIRERAEIIGAQLEIQSGEGQGTSVRVSVPVAKEAT